MAQFSDDFTNSKVFFSESDGGKVLVPRNLFVDLEPSVAAEVTKKHPDFYNAEFTLCGKEDAANNFARGHYTVGKEVMDTVNEKLKKLVEACDNVQGFLMTHSVGGGTGSGLGMLILERLAVDYRKKSKIGFEIYPSPNISTCIVEPYNGLLSTHWLLDHTEVSLVLDNEAMYEIMEKKCKMKVVTYGALNRLVAKITSCMTAALRFGGELNVDMNEFQTNLVPFPRLHFMTCSYSPITAMVDFMKDGKLPEGLTAASMDAQSSDPWKVTEQALNPENFCVKFSDFDATEDKYMAISLNYRGDILPKSANECVQKIKKANKVSFVEWMPTGFKIGLNQTPAESRDGDPFAKQKQTCAMVGNNIAINRVFTERLSKKYDMMYSQRAYVHWYVGEGMEEGEFSEAREDLGFLEKDYLDVVTEQASDDQENEEGDDEF